MLREVLATRVECKRLMAAAKRAGMTHVAATLNARQFGLKLLANVTYGYAPPARNISTCLCFM
jgi:DNA polymerase elongation subunit (family B)